MARTSTYLNFPRETEAAFLFYRSVFGGDFTAPGIRRFRDVPPDPAAPPMDPADVDLVMHVELPITGGHVLMGTDSPPSMGFTVVTGTNVHLNLEPDTLAEGQRLFEALSVGGTVEMPLQPMFWGATFGSLTDRFGIRWMVNCPTP